VEVVVCLLVVRLLVVLLPVVQVCWVALLR
jgi:hypothetical protein